MAFINRVLLIVPSFGTPLQNDSLLSAVATAITQAGSPQTISLTGITPALRDGWVRVKLYGCTTALTITICTVYVTDGTTFVWVGDFAPSTGVTLGTTGSSTAYTKAGSATTPGGLELLFPFLTDLAVTQVSVVLTMTGASGAAVADIEVGATN